MMEQTKIFSVIQKIKRHIFSGKKERGTFGYNQLHINALYNLLDFRYVHTLIQSPYEENESSALIHMVKDLRETEKQSLLQIGDMKLTIFLQIFRKKVSSILLE